MSSPDRRTTACPVAWRPIWGHWLGGRRGIVAGLTLALAASPLLGARRRPPDVPALEPDLMVAEETVVGVDDLHDLPERAPPRPVVAGVPVERPATFHVSPVNPTHQFAPPIFSSYPI